jgi:hypothetical protein
MGWACSTYGEGKERHIQCFGGKPEQKISLGTPRHRWEDYIKTDPKKVGWEGHGLD